MYSDTAAMENSNMVDHQKIKSRIASNFFRRYISKRIGSRDFSKYLYANVLFSTTHSCPKRGNNTSVRQQIKEQTKVCVDTQWHISQPWKKNAILRHAVTQMNPGNTMLSKINQPHRRTEIVWFCSYRIPRIGKFTEAAGTLGYQGLGEGGMRSYYLMHIRLLVGWFKKMFWKQWWCFYNIVNVINTIELYT